MNQKKAILAMLLIAAGITTAKADMSIEQSQTYNQQGQQQTMKTSISPSDFDPNRIAFNLSSATPRLVQIYSITPSDPSPQSVDAATKAAQKGLAMAARNQAVIASRPPAVMNWVAWGIDVGFIDPDYYSRQLGQCLSTAMSDPDMQGRFNRIEGCYVSAYLNTYTMNRNGYAGGKMIGLVPLCEVSQQNDCNITGGAFNPFDEWNRRQEREAARQKRMAQEKEGRVQAMHQKALERYNMLIKGIVPPEGTFVPDACNTTDQASFAACMRAQFEQKGGE